MKKFISLRYNTNQLDQQIIINLNIVRHYRFSKADGLCNLTLQYKNGDEQKYVGIIAENIKNQIVAILEPSIIEVQEAIF